MISLLWFKSLLNRGEFGLGKGRLEAFTDGVSAIIITIMVLEIKTPQSVNFSDLVSFSPLLLTYALSFT